MRKRADARESRAFAESSTAGSLLSLASRRLAVAVAVAALFLVVGPPGHRPFAGRFAAAQSPPPNEAWRQIVTSHFVVTYPEGLEELAERAAQRAERAHALLSERFADEPAGPVQLLLTDHADFSNGFATPLPFNQITIYARPPIDGGSLSYFDDWLELVVTHELVHTFHFDMAGAPGKAIRAVLGRYPAPWPVFPSAATPTWMSEGLATYFESSLTGAGRAKGTWQEMVMRTAALEGALGSLDQVAGNSPAWPAGSRPYVYGARYLDRMAGVHGEESLGEFARSVAGLWIPFRLNAAARDAFGESVSESWDAWRRETTGRWESFAASLEAAVPATEGDVVDGSARTPRQAVASRDGSALAFVRSDGVDKAQIRVSRPDGSNSRFLARLNGPGGALSWGPDGALFFSQLEFEGRYRVLSDLYRATPDGTVERLTRGRRLSYPDVSPDGGRVVAVQEGDGTSALAMMELATGDLTLLVPPAPDVHWAHPRWSPDGRHVAAVRWRRPAMMDVVVLEADGTLAAELARDRAVDTTPFWSPDGSWVLWSSDRTGVPNIFAARFPPAPPPVPGADPTAGPRPPTAVRQVTNVLGGATHPAVDPRGRWLYFSSYHADGWRLERAPYDPSAWFAPGPTSPRFDEGSGGLDDPPSQPGADRPGAEPLSATATDARPLEASAPRDYRAGQTLRPYYWTPVASRAEQGTDRSGVRRDVIRPSFGLRTGGSDLVGRHRYSASARLSLDRRFSGGFGYAYRGLGNPDLGLTFSQSHDPSSRSIPVRLADGNTAEYFLLERERRANLSVSFTRRRYRSSTALSVNGGVAREDLTLQELGGGPGPVLSSPPPRSNHLDVGAVLSFSNAQRRAFSFSREDGISAFVRGRLRRETGIEGERRGVAGRDRSYGEVLGEASAYKAVGGPGFANHVLALRLSGGAAFGPGADQRHFDAGGAEGAREELSGLGLFGGSPLLFPLRGYPENFRSGRVAWTASVEYRFPLLMIDRGLGAFPLFFDRVHGSVFFDAGNAWGPVAGQPGYDNPRGPALASAGVEVSAIVLPFYARGLTLRAGVAVPLRVVSGPTFHVRLGNAF